MNNKSFDVCLDFHNALVRPSINEQTIENARKILVDNDKRLPGVGAYQRFRARSLASKLNQRYDVLKKWGKSSWNKKMSLYITSSRAPSKGAVKACRDIMKENSDASIATASTRHKVNYQCVKVLLQRVKRYDAFSIKLNETL